MEKWDTAYSRGYFKALLDMRNMLDRFYDDDLKSKKRYKNMVLSYLKLLTEDSYLRDEFMQTGGNEDWKKLGIIMKSNGEIVRKSDERS